MSVRDLIDAIYVGDSESIETAFNHEMAERISTRLDAMRVEVAKNMFNEQVEELDELEEELDEEQLDELSKDTLKSYVDKAATRLVSGDKYKGMDRYNRVDGIKKATSKLVKQEETE